MSSFYGSCFYFRWSVNGGSRAGCEENPVQIFGARLLPRVYDVPHAEVSMDSVVTFLTTQSPDAAIAFYRDKLGLRFLRDDGFALVFDMNGVMLRIAKAKSFTPAQGTVLGWEARDLAATMKKLGQAGVNFERYPNMGQDADGVCTFPNGDRVAWFKDPDGNVLSISQHAASAPRS
jgi:catechol 2,3-dioxygenase-like lactoylglutathione lyase family enzyme